jgi:hypothetical protein
MKLTRVRFEKSVLVEVEKPRLQEVWDKQFNRWDELVVQAYEEAGNFANLHDLDGNTYWNVPRDSFIFLKEPPRPF